MNADRRQTVFQAYFTHFRKYHFGPELTNAKSAAEARLAKIAGSRMCAFVVWEIGFPRLSLVPPTEQHEDRNARLETDATCVLAWLSTVAQALREQVDTSVSADVRDRPGHAHGALLLTEQEAERMVDMRRAVQRLRTGRWLHRAAGRWQFSEQQLDLLQEYKHGRLQEQVDEIRGRRARLAQRLGEVVRQRYANACC